MSLLTRRTDDVIAHLGVMPAPSVQPTLVALAGLPGAGKSTFAAALRARSPVVVVESDAMRRMLFPQPRHTPRENAAVFLVLHEVLRRLLAHSISVVADATSLRERERKPLYRIAGHASARIIVAALTAPEEELRRRVSQRDAVLAGVGSAAGVAVYERMATRKEPIRRQYYLIDTSGDTDWAVEAIAREIETA